MRGGECSVGGRGLSVGEVPHLSVGFRRRSPSFVLPLLSDIEYSQSTSPEPVRAFRFQPIDAISRLVPVRNSSPEHLFGKHLFQLRGIDRNQSELYGIVRNQSRRQQFASYLYLRIFLNAA